MGPSIGLDVIYKKEISCLCGIRTPGPQTRSKVTIQTTLLRFQCNRCTVKYTINKNLNNISEYGSNMQFVDFHLGSYVIFSQTFGKALLLGLNSVQVREEEPIRQQSQNTTNG